MTGLEAHILAERGVLDGQMISGSVEETHISWVILTDKYAFKLKKPLKLSFLDFSTLNLRKKYCEEEVRLNSRFSDIYLSVRPVRRHDSQWFIGGQKGEIADYAVQMERMITSNRMDNKLKLGGVSEVDMQTLAAIVAYFHKSEKPVYTAFQLSEARDLFNDIVGIRNFVEQSHGTSYLQVIDRSIRWSNDFLESHATRFQQRIDHGFKRDVHGDLHSGNIFLNKKPILFDCIEFNDQYRQIDVLYEVAFLCMDLEAVKQKHLSEAFITSYNNDFPCFEVAEDQSVFNYFKCLRANVRAKVHGMSAMQAHDEGQQTQHAGQVKRYLDLVSGYIQ